MENFEKRRDRYEFFEGFENPLVNLTFKVETEDFLTYCKSQNIPVFHFFLFCLMRTLNTLDSFKYRHIDGKVFKIDQIVGSYTVMNEDNNLNYTRFEYSPQREEFIKRSLKAREEAIHSKELIHTGRELELREIKNYVFMTCLPWLDFTSIQHPVYQFKSSDIPSIAWGKFTKVDQKIVLPFSVQAHHGFIDGFHIYELSQKLVETISKEMKA